MGAQVGGCAADDAKKAGLVPIDRKELDTGLDMIKSFVKDKKKGMRPVFLKEEILKAMDTYVAPFRDAKGLSGGTRDRAGCGCSRIDHRIGPLQNRIERPPQPHRFSRNKQQRLAVPFDRPEESWKAVLLEKRCDIY
jgi:hypothetical protein